MVCDICSTPGVGVMVGAKDMRQAVFESGFNPFTLGLWRNKPPAYFEFWKNTIVGKDSSDWNVCSNCMAKLGPFLKGAPNPTGVPLSVITHEDALKGALEAARLAEGKGKKWWQFWKQAV